MSEPSNRTSCEERLICICFEDIVIKLTAIAGLLLHSTLAEKMYSTYQTKDLGT